MAQRHIKIHKSYNYKNKVTLYQGDCLKFLRTLRSGSVQLIVTSPPYNVGKEYEKRLEIDHYLEMQSLVIKEFKRILKPEGSICWQTGNYVRGSSKGPKSIIPLDILFHNVFADFGFQLRNRIIWTFGHGLHSQHRLSGRYETIMWYTKSEKYIFNLDAVRVKQKYRGKRAYRGANKGKPSGNPYGKNPSDFWDDLGYEDHELLLMEQMTDLWNHIPNIKGNHIEKADHPCQFPISLVKRLIRMLSNKRHLILDPYVGTGSTLIAGLQEKRRVAGAEIEPAYIKIAKNRLRKYFNNELKFREEKPIYRPNGSMKVAREPEEWERSI